MPRGPRKTASGVPAQTGPGVAGQTYGQGVEQQALEAVMPTPNNAAAPDAAAAPPPPVEAAAAPASQQTDPSDRYAAALAAAADIRSQTGALNRPTDRPMEPITAGMSLGPGAGPDSLRRPPSRTGSLLRELSLRTGDPRWAEMAQKARMQ